MEGNWSTLPREVQSFDLLVPQLFDTTESIVHFQHVLKREDCEHNQSPRRVSSTRESEWQTNRMLSHCDKVPFHVSEIFPYSEMAQAKPNPSAVDVPLPNSSTMINEQLVAL